jgi:hypothetical protein
MGFSLVGTVISILMLLPSVVFFTMFPPINMPEGLREAPAVFTVLKNIGQAGCFGILVVSKNRLRLGTISIWAVPMLSLSQHILTTGDHVAVADTYPEKWPIAALPRLEQLTLACLFGHSQRITSGKHVLT